MFFENALVSRVNRRVPGAVVVPLLRASFSALSALPFGPDQPKARDGHHNDEQQDPSNYGAEQIAQRAEDDDPDEGAEQAES